MVEGAPQGHEGWIENGRIVGKKITAYWDGNQKVFLLTKPKSPIGIACQGLLFWGDERKLLATVIADFEKILILTDNVKIVATNLNNYFRQMKRKRSNKFEVMHFLVAGIQEGKPQVFYVNTYEQGSVEQVAPMPVKWGLINGDGKATSIEDGHNITLDQGIDYVKNIILKEHKKEASRCRKYLGYSSDSNKRKTLLAHPLSSSCGLFNL